MCDSYRDCVQCRIHKAGPLTDEECAKCSINPIATSEYEVREGEESCVFWDENDCLYNFKYNYDEQTEAVYVVAKKEKDCPEPLDILAIVIGLIIGIVLIGLALLAIWKIFTIIKDKREIAKFNEERSKAKWETVSHFQVCFAHRFY